MKDFDKRLEIIYTEIEKKLSLQRELQDEVKQLKCDNQILTDKLMALKEQVNKQNKQEINNKINELLSEVERCIKLLM